MDDDEKYRGTFFGANREFLRYLARRQNDDDDPDYLENPGSLNPFNSENRFQELMRKRMEELYLEQWYESDPKIIEDKLIELESEIDRQIELLDYYRRINADFGLVSNIRLYIDKLIIKYNKESEKYKLMGPRIFRRTLRNRSR